MNLAAINSPASAFVAGIVTSVHCVAMCGPIACWLTPKGSTEDATTVYVAYQGSRLFSYALFGALMGGLGEVSLSFFHSSVIACLPWLTVGFFILIALGLDRRLKKPAIIARMGFRIHRWVRGRSELSAAVIVGGATPLLPCGPLYLVAALAGLTGSVARGSEFMVAFGLGTLPLLWFAQLFFAKFRASVSPSRLAVLQRSIALIAAGVIAWRLRGTLGWGGEGVSEWVCF